MNKFITSALAISATGSLTLAGPGDDDWSTLDEDLESLRSPAIQGEGIDLGALLRSTWETREDAFGADEDSSGFELLDVDVWLEGEIGDFDWRISSDLAGVQDPYSFSASPDYEFQLEDAWADFSVNEATSVTMGQFKAPTTFSTAIDPEDQLLLRRPLIGQSLDVWDQGAMVYYGSDMLHAFFALSNGISELEAKHRYTFRVDVNFGDGAAGAFDGWAMRNGNRAQGDTTRVGVFYVNDNGNGASADDQLYGLDLASSFGTFLVEAEVVKVDEDSGDGGGPTFGGDMAFGVLQPDSTPWDIAGQVNLNDAFDVALRYEDWDDSADSSIWTAGLDWYPGDDPTLRWSIEVDIGDSDAVQLDGNALRIGLTLGGTRPGPSRSK